MAYYKPKRKWTQKKSYFVKRVNSLGIIEKVIKFKRFGPWMDPHGPLARWIAAQMGGDFVELA